MPKKQHPPAKKRKSRKPTAGARTAASKSGRKTSSAATSVAKSTEPSVSVPAKAGRPSSYTPEVAKVICDRLAEGESLRQICRDDNMPDKETVRRWKHDIEEFRAQYTRAREEQAEGFLDEIIEIVDDGTNDWIDREVGGGRTIRVVDQEAVQRSKLRYDARRWAMSKILPKKYGDSTTIKGDKDNPIYTAPMAIVVPKKDVSTAATGPVAPKPAPG